MKDIISNIKLIIFNTFNFRGLTKRRVYWNYFAFWFVLQQISVLLFGFFEIKYTFNNPDIYNGLIYFDYFSILNFIFFIPLISATVRRLRDAGYPVILIFLPIINFLFCTAPSKNLA